jgi:hypothetical protein
MTVIIECISSLINVNDINDAARWKTEINSSVTLLDISVGSEN